MPLSDLFQTHARAFRKLATRHGGSLRDFHAVFDLGTRASRLLVGPDDANRMLNADYIATVSTETFLGSAIDLTTKAMPLGEHLETVASFMRETCDVLIKLGLPKEKIRAAGTAIFREISNQDEVLAFLQENTGITPTIISEGYEARLSLLSVVMNFRQEAWVKEGDFFLLVDQGGGSTEVSYTPVVRSGIPAAVEMQALSMPIGTLRLAAEALGASGENDEELSAEQHSRVKRLTATTLNALDGFGAEMRGTTTHCFGMGSAITRMSTGSLWQINGTLASYTTIAQRLEKLTRQYRGTPITANKGDMDYVQLYGLPVFLAVMDRFSIGKLRICGFGLRFGLLYEGSLGVDLSARPEEITAT